MLQQLPRGDVRRGALRAHAHAGCSTSSTARRSCWPTPTARTSA
jgi:hypothetical protein